MFEGLIDVGAILGELEDMFPNRIKVGSEQTTTSKTGGQVPGAFVPLAGLSDIGSQRSNADELETATITEPRVTATHVFTLPGAWPAIKAGMIVVEIESGLRYSVLLVDVHEFGFHTELKTKLVTK